MSTIEPDGGDVLVELDGDDLGCGNGVATHAEIVGSPDPAGAERRDTAPNENLLAVFIILDEILKGTNSKDKQAGSKALVRKLVSLKASGIIATHDLSLGDLEHSFPENVKNRCFEIIIERDKLEYDYLLKEGIARNMNATILMEKMGITEV